MAPPRPDVSEERRNQILDVAENVFAKRGLNDARMDDVAEQSGLSKGAVYWYFRKKDDLIAGLLERVFRRNFAAVEQIASSEGSIAERLMRVTERTASDYKALSRLAPIAVDFYALALRNRGVRTFISKMYSRYRIVLEQLLREGIRKNELRADLDVSQSVATVLALYEGMGLMWAVERSSIDWNRTPMAAAQLLLEGMKR